MKHLYDYILEELSQTSIDKLSAILTDEQVDEIIDFLQKNYKKSKRITELLNKLSKEEELDNDKIKDLTKRKKKDKSITDEINDLDVSFFAKNGLKDLNWGRKTTAKDVFVNLFKNKLDILEKIIADNGFIKFENIPLEGNIFELCEGWEDEAVTLAFMTNSKSANAGPFEILLKFMINEAHQGSSGDVSIEKEMLEVKAVTYSKTANGLKDLSGGHAAGQKSKYILSKEITGDAEDSELDVKIRMTWAQNQVINEYGFNMSKDDANKEAKQNNYFGKLDSFNLLNKRIKEYNLSSDDVAELILNSILYQYHFVEDKLETSNKYKLKPTKLSHLINYNDVLTNFKDTKIFTENGITNQHDFLDVIGALQLYLYSIIEGFDNLFIGYLDKIEDVSNGEIVKLNNFKSGYYILFKHLKTDNKLINFKNIIKHLTFGSLDMVNSTQGRTGKIYFKTLKTWGNTKKNKKTV